MRKLLPLVAALAFFYLGTAVQEQIDLRRGTDPTDP